MIFELSCIKCGYDVESAVEIFNPQEHMFCKKCGAMREIPSIYSKNYFAFFGFKPSLVIDLVKLREVYFENMRVLHPDNFVQLNRRYVESRGDVENDFGVVSECDRGNADVAADMAHFEKCAAFCNEAFRVLNSFIERSRHFLMQRGRILNDDEAGAGAVDANYMAMIFNLNCELAEIETLPECRLFIDRVNKIISAESHKMIDAEKEGDLSGIESGITRINFLTRMNKNASAQLRKML